MEESRLEEGEEGRMEKGRIEEGEEGRLEVEEGRLEVEVAVSMTTMCEDSSIGECCETITLRFLNLC